PSPAFECCPCRRTRLRTVRRASVPALLRRSLPPPPESSAAPRWKTPHQILASQLPSFLNQLRLVTLACSVHLAGCAGPAARSYLPQLDSQLSCVHHLKLQRRKFPFCLGNHLLRPVHSQHFRASRCYFRRQRPRPAAQIQDAFARLRRQQLHQALRPLVHEGMLRVILRCIPLICHSPTPTHSLRRIERQGHVCARSNVHLLLDEPQRAICNFKPLPPEICNLTLLLSVLLGRFCTLRVFASRKGKGF